MMQSQGGEAGMRNEFRLILIILIAGLLLTCRTEEKKHIFSPPDTTPPSRVTDLTASSTIDSLVLLSWTAPGDDDTVGTAAQYCIRMHSVPLNIFTWHAGTLVESALTPQAAGMPESLYVGSLPPDSTFYFYVRAADEDSNWSDISNEASAKIFRGIDSIPPAQTTDLTATIVEDSLVMLLWTAPGDDDTIGTAAQYDIRYHYASITNENWDAAVPVDNIPVPKSAGVPESLLVRGLPYDLTVYFCLRAVDDSSNWSGLSNVVSGMIHDPNDTIPPAAVLDLRVIDSTVTSITVAWTAPGDNGNFGAAHEYDLRWSTNEIDETSFGFAERLPTGIPKPFGCIETFKVDELTDCGPFYFAVKSVDEAGNWSGISNIIAAYTVDVDWIPPSRITDLALVDSSESSLTIAWTAPGDDGDLGMASRYEIKVSGRSMNENNCEGICDRPEFATFCAQAYDCIPVYSAGPAPAPSGTMQSFTISGLPTPRGYYIRMHAVDNAGNPSGISNEILGYTRYDIDIIPPARIDDLSITRVRSSAISLSWWSTGDDGDFGEATSYDLRYLIGTVITEDNWSVAIPVENVPSPGLWMDHSTVEGLMPATEYSFALVAIDDVGLASALSNVVTVSTTSSDNQWMIMESRGTVTGLAAADDGGVMHISNEGYYYKTDVDGNYLYTDRVDTRLHAITALSWGGFVLAGGSLTCRGYPWIYCEGWVDLVVIEAGGNTLFSNDYLYDSGYRDVSSIGNAVIETSDGGYIVAGVRIWYDGFLFKVDGTGVASWYASLAGMDTANSIIPVNSDFLIAGTADGDAYLIKTNQLGVIQWGIGYGGIGDEGAQSMVQVEENEFLLCGYTESFGAGMRDVYVVRVDSMGNTLDEYTYGGAGYDHGESIRATSDGNFVIAGWTNSYGNGDNDVYLIKIDPSGSVIWERTIGGYDDDGAMDVIETTDGSLIVGGWAESYAAGNRKEFLVKLNANGEL